MFVWPHARSKSPLLPKPGRSGAPFRAEKLCQSLIIKRFFMAAILERIVAATRARVAEAKRGADLRELEQRAERHVPRGFRRALEAKSREGVR